MDFNGRGICGSSSMLMDVGPCPTDGTNRNTIVMIVAPLGCLLQSPSSVDPSLDAHQFHVIVEHGPQQLHLHPRPIPATLCFENSDIPCDHTRLLPSALFRKLSSRLSPLSLTIAQCPRGLARGVQLCSKSDLHTRVIAPLLGDGVSREHPRGHG